MYTALPTCIGMYIYNCSTIYTCVLFTALMCISDACREEGKGESVLCVRGEMRVIVDVRGSHTQI